MRRRAPEQQELEKEAAIGVNLSQNAYSQKISLKAGGSKSRLKKRLVYKKVSKKQMARQHPRRKGNPDLRRRYCVKCQGETGKKSVSSSKTTLGRAHLVWSNGFPDLRTP